MSVMRQDVMDALVWLDLARVQALLQALVKGPPDSWQAAVNRLVPDLKGEADLSDPAWHEALVEELERRVAGIDDDPDDVQTSEVPDLARFAVDLRDPDE